MGIEPSLLLLPISCSLFPTPCSLCLLVYFGVSSRFTNVRCGSQAVWGSSKGSGFVGKWLVVNLSRYRNPLAAKNRD